jgi:inner membrane protein
MDPIAHTFTGAALAATGLRRATPLATAALLIGANVPDVDVATMFVGDFYDLALRRGWTHGVLALALWPLVVTGLLLAWDRRVRRRRDPIALPARAGPLLALSALAVLTHPTLDWLNNYGLRWLMPFDGRWFYGDALFIVDPWMWLALGGVVFLNFSRSRSARVGWAVFWLLASAVVVMNSPALVPPWAMVVWLLGVIAIVAVRALRRLDDIGRERAARIALVLVALYVGAMVTADRLERAAVRLVLSVALPDLDEVMVAPDPANPFGGDVVVSTEDAYITGRWNWLGNPRFVHDGGQILRPRGAVFEAAARAPAARRYLSWARFPYVEVTDGPDGTRAVRFHDARYRKPERIEGPTVLLDHELRVVPAAVAATEGTDSSLDN